MVMACDKFVHLVCVSHMIVCSMFNILIRGKWCPDKCASKAWNKWKLPGAKSKLYRGRSSIPQHKFATSSKSTVPRAAEYCYGREPHHRLEDWDVFSWPTASFSARQDMLGLTGCPCSRQSTSNTTDESQKMMVSTLPAHHITLNLCFLVQLGCIHDRVHHLLVGMNSRSMYHRVGR
jgi:hypothetical protein